MCAANRMFARSVKDPMHLLDLNDVMNQLANRQGVVCIEGGGGSGGYVLRK